MAERIHDGEKVLDVGTGRGRRLFELGLFESELTPGQTLES